MWSDPEVSVKLPDIMDEFNQPKRQHFVEYHEKSGTTSFFLQTLKALWNNFVTSTEETYFQICFCVAFNNCGPSLDKIPHAEIEKHDTEGYVGPNVKSVAFEKHNKNT